MGKNNIDLVQNYAKKFILAVLVMGFINSCLLLLLLPVITLFYNISLETIVLVNKMGRFAAITIIFISISNILCFGVVKSRGNTLQILKLEIVVNLFIAISLGLITAFVLKFPPEYLYIILRLGTFLIGIWGLYQVGTGKWIENN